VAGNLTDALLTLFDPVALGIVGLVTSRHELLSRLRERTPTGMPLLTEATAVVASYLEAERDLGRIAPDADIRTLAPMLIGAGHLLFAGRDSPPTRAAVRRAVLGAIGPAIRSPA